MELKELLKIARQNIIPVLFFAILGAVFALYSSFGLPKGTRVESSYFTTTQSSQAIIDEQAAFYAQEKARNFTESAIAILESDEFVSKLNSSSRISADQVASQVITVSISGTSKADVSSILAQIPEEFNKIISDLDGSQNPVILKSIGSNQSFNKFGPNKYVFATFGALIGITLAIFSLGLKTYFKL